ASCINHEESHQFLLNYFRESSHAHGDDSLSAVEHAVLVALFLSAHMPEHHGQLLLKDIAARANSCLRDEGESFRLSVRHAGIIATSFGFSRRHRTTNGWKLVLEKSDQLPLHKIAASYNVDHFPDNAGGLTRCPLCPNVKLASQPFATGVLY